MSAQVVWTRLLSLLFGGTVYTFSLILAVFLLGLGVGSAGGAALSRRSSDPGRLLGWAQLLVAVAMVWAGYLLMARLPFVPVDTEVMFDPLQKYRLDLWRCAQVVLPAALCWGASFPLALAALVRPGQDPGRLVGGVYAANTLGAIAGSLGIGLFLVAQLGSQHTQQLLVALSVVAGVLMLAPGGAARPSAARSRSPRRWLPAATAALVGLAAIAGAVGLPPVPGVLVAFGRVAPLWVGAAEITYVGEGLNAFVAVSETPTGVLAYHNSGKVQAGSEGQDLRLQRMLGHLSHLVPKNPKDALVIGLGAGVTAGAVAIAPSVERVTIVEIEPLVPKAVAAYFGDYNSHVVTDPKVTVHIDDGRHYLLTTQRKFDVITSDPLDPWIKGAATLFTEEFFETMRRHLAPGGVVTQFVQLYGSNTDAVRSEIGTFIKVFPHTLVFGNLAEGQGYDLVLVGQVEPMSIDADALQARLADPSYKRVAASLRDVGIVSAVDLLGNYAGSAADLEPWLRGATINTDRNLRLQYLAGLTLNAVDGGDIYREMLGHARFPDRIFTGSPAMLEQLAARIAARATHTPMTRRTACVVLVSGLLAAEHRMWTRPVSPGGAAAAHASRDRHRNTARRRGHRRLSMAGRHRAARWRRGRTRSGATRAPCSMPYPAAPNWRPGSPSSRAAATCRCRSSAAIATSTGIATRPSPSPRCLRATAPSARSGRCSGPSTSTRPAAPCRAGSCRPPTAGGWRWASPADGAQGVLRLVDVATGRLLPLEIGGSPHAVSWLPDSTGFIYKRLARPTDAASTVILFHQLGADPASDVLIHRQYTAAENPYLATTAGPLATFSRDGRWVVAGYWTVGRLERSLADRFRGASPHRADHAADRDGRQTRARRRHRDWQHPVRRDHEGRAERPCRGGRRAAIPARPRWRDIVPERPDAIIDSVTFAGGVIAVTYLEARLECHRGLRSCGPARSVPSRSPASARRRCPRAPIGPMPFCCSRASTARRPSTA